MRLLTKSDQPPSRNSRRREYEAEQEFEQIQLNVKREKTTVTPWHTLFLGKYRLLVIADIGVAVFRQFQGANAIFYYIPLIVEKVTGHATSDALMWPIIQGIILVASSLPFLVIADKFNQRTLLKIDGNVMGFSFTLPVVLGTVLDVHANSLLILLFLCIYVAFYSYTWAPLTWVIVGEIFPLAVRRRASDLASSFNWIGSFLVGLFFPVMTASMPQEIVLGIFGIICFLGVLFIQEIVPETRGKSLEGVEQSASKKTHPKRISIHHS